MPTSSVGQALGDVTAGADDARLVRPDVADAQNAAIAGRHVYLESVVGDGHQLLLPEVVDRQPAAGRREMPRPLRLTDSVFPSGRGCQAQHVPLQPRPGDSEVPDRCVAGPVHEANRLLRTDTEEHLDPIGRKTRMALAGEGIAHFSGAAEGPFASPFAAPP